MRWSLMVPVAASLLVASSVGAGAKTKITFMTWFTGAGLETKKQLIDEFMRQNPDIEVEILHGTSPSGLVEKLSVMTAGGTAPDVTEVQHGMLEAMFTTNPWEDLGPFLRADRSLDLRNYFPEMIKFFNKNNTVGGSGQMALPTVSYAQAMYYNIDLFNQAGLPTPAQYHEQRNWNWTTFEEAARKLTADRNGDGTPDQYGFSMVPGWIWAIIVRDNGGELYTPDGLRTTVTEPAVVQATQWLADLMNTRKIALWDTWDHQAFQQGRSAMFGTALWMADILNRGGRINYDAAPWFTRDVSRPHQGMSGDGVAIAAGSKNKEAAWKLVKFFLTREAQAVLGQTVGIPVRADVARSREFTQSGQRPNKSAFVYELAEKSAVYLPRFVPSQASSLIDGALDQVFRGRQPAAVALSGVADAVNEILRTRAAAGR